MSRIVKHFGQAIILGLQADEICDDFAPQMKEIQEVLIGGKRKNIIN